MNYSDYQYHYIDDASTHQIFTGRGMLHAIVIGEAAAGTISVIDNTAGSTVNVALLKASLVLPDSIGGRILKEALQAPIKQIIKNAGYDDKEILSKI